MRLYKGFIRVYWSSVGRNYAFLVAKALQEGLGCAVLTDPRFGWKHDFFLPLHEVCWRKADHLGNTDVY